MPFLIDFSLSLGAAIPANVLVIGSTAQGVIGTNTVGTGAILADYSNRLIAISTQRTADRANGPLVSYNAGTATVKLLNMDGLLDPYTIEQAGLSAPGVVMRIRYQYGATLYPVFWGTVDAWNPDAEAPTLGTVTVTATDGFSLLNQLLPSLTSPIGPGSLVSTRINAALDAVGWPSAQRSIGAANSTLQQTYFGQNALEEIQDAVKAEVGEFYQQPDGIMYFRGRQAMVSDDRSANSQATFGSNWAGGEIPYVGRPESAWDKTQLHNTVYATIDGGSNVQTATNAASVQRYGTQALEDSSLKLPADSDALSWANYVLAQDNKPVYKMSAITLDQAVEQIGISVMPHMLGRRLGDRVIVVRRPPAAPYGSIVDSRQMFVQGIAHEWSATANRLKTTFSIAPVSTTPFFVIGSATQGVIGTNLIGW